MNTTASRPQYTMLRPTSRQFPFDAVCAEIAQSLENRNWNVPGIEVEFRTYGSGEALYRMVDKISGEDFVIEFGRNQGYATPSLFDAAAADRIAIPGFDVNVYQEEDGPTVGEYIGDDWARDREAFLRYGHKFDDDPEGRWLAFHATCDCKAANDSFGYYRDRSSVPHTHPGKRTPLLIAKSDEQRKHRTGGLYQRLASWLRQNVLPVIEAVPLSAPDFSRFDVEDIAFPDGLPEFYAFVELTDASRIARGQKDRTQLEPGKRYALQQGYRLATLGTSRKDIPFPDIAYDGFIWCGFGSVTSETPIDDLEVPGHFRWNEDVVCRITPNRANDVYVADQTPFDTRREEIWAGLGEGGRMTGEQEQSMYAVRAATIVPVTAYDGGFKKPILLIGRELGFDEIELVSGPTKGWQKREWEEIMG